MSMYGSRRAWLLGVTLCSDDDVAAHRSSRMNCEVYRAIVSVQIQPNAAKLIGQRFTVWMYNDQNILQK